MMIVKDKFDVHLMVWQKCVLSDNPSIILDVKVLFSEEKS